MAGRVALVGGRRLSPSASEQMGHVAASLVGRGHRLVTGCATGADAAVVAAALSGRLPVSALQVRAAFGPQGQGACAVSATSLVRAFAARGGAVAWWSGGAPSVPLRARLAQRTVQVVEQASGGLVAVQPGPGSWRACRLAVARGLSVVVVTSRPVLLGAGGWVPCKAPGLAGVAWRWEAAPALW